jgi:hypothetical protein
MRRVILLCPVSLRLAIGEILAVNVQRLAIIRNLAAVLQAFQVPNTCNRGRAVEVGISGYEVVCAASTASAEDRPIRALAISITFGQQPLMDMLMSRSELPWKRIRGAWW